MHHAQVVLPKDEGIQFLILARVVTQLFVDGHRLGEVDALDDGVLDPGYLSEHFEDQGE